MRRQPDATLAELVAEISVRHDTRRQRVGVDAAVSSGPTNAGSRSPEVVDAAVAGRPPLGLHNRAE
jgi:hypothetical protein